MAPLRAALVALALALVTFVARPARAWVEVHVERDDVRLSLDRDGGARVEHRIALRVAGGPLPAFDLVGVDADADPDPDGYAVPEKSAEKGSLADLSPIQLERMPPPIPRDGEPPPKTTLRVRFDGKGLPHGAWVLLVRYRTALAARGLVVRDGSLARVRWTAPVFDDGLNDARVVFELPAAPTEPRADDHVDDAAADDAPTNAPTVLSTLRRGPEKDELELLRPYVPKGEAIVWAIRVDARAVGRPDAPPARVAAAPVAPTTPAAVLEAARPTLIFVAAGLLFALYTALVVWKGLEVARAAKAAGVAARPLVPLPLGVRAVFAGLLLTAGVAAEIRLESSTVGGLLIGAAIALAVHLTPRWNRARRGPGKWLPITEAEAFRKPPRPRGAWLDVSTREGKVFLFVTLAAVGVGVFFVAETSPYHATLLGLDATALLALFGTGRLRELPPDPVAASARFLAPVARRLHKKGGDLKVVPRVRVPKDSPDADELRLQLAPRRALPGLVAIEIGVVFARGAGGPIALPEVLVRFAESTPCAAALASLAQSARVLRGRRPDERVLAFAPRLPTSRLVATLALALAAKTTDAARAPAPKPSAKPVRAAAKRAA